MGRKIVLYSVLWVAHHQALRTTALKHASLSYFLAHKKESKKVRNEFEKMLFLGGRIKSPEKFWIKFISFWIILFFCKIFERCWVNPFCASAEKTEVVKNKLFFLLHLLLNYSRKIVAGRSLYTALLQSCCCCCCCNGR